MYGSCNKLKCFNDGECTMFNDRAICVCRGSFTGVLCQVILVNRVWSQLNNFQKSSRFEIL